MDMVLIRDYRAQVGDNEEKANRSFQILRMDIKKVHTIRAKNKAEKDEWMKDLQRIVNQYLAKLQESQKIPQVKPPYSRHFGFSDSDSWVWQDI